MSKPYQTGVRLTDEQRDALERMKADTKLDVADLIRHAVDALIQHYERCGRRLVLPVDFSEVVEVYKASSVPTEPREAKRAA